MMLWHAIVSEWRKFATTKGIWVTAALVLAPSLLMTLALVWELRTMAESLGAAAAGGFPGGLHAGPDMVVLGLKGFGLLVLMVQAVLGVTGEFAHGTIEPTVLATPRRWVTGAAKSIIYGLYAAAVTIATAALGFLMASLLLPEGMHDGIGLLGVPALKTYAILGLWAALTAPLCVGVALLVRSAAAATAILLLWRVAAENLVGLIPRIGGHLVGWMPFAGVSHFYETALGQPAEMGVVAWPQPWIGMVWFAFCAVALLALGCWAHASRGLKATGE